MGLIGFQSIRIKNGRCAKADIFVKTLTIPKTCGAAIPVDVILLSMEKSHLTLKKQNNHDTKPD